MDSSPLKTPHPAIQNSLIELDEVSVSVHGTPILKHITFTSETARLGVVGRNGSGKSTLARVLAGLVPPDSGQARMNGKDLARDRRAALQEVGILFQNPDHQIIFPTVMEEIMFGLIQQGHTKSEASEIAHEILNRFSISHWKDVYIQHLSQGQKHLVCIMAIIAMKPRTLILDEPFAGFDLPTRSQLQYYLEYFEGTVIHITHQPEDLTDYSQVIWLDCGRIHANGSANDILPTYTDKMIALVKNHDLADFTG